MKTTILIVLLIAVRVCFSQDIIMMRTGEEIKAKVQEVGTDQIKYNKYGTDAPLYVIKKADVFMIKYENGTKDLINTEIKRTDIVDDSGIKKQSLNVKDSVPKRKRNRALIGVCFSPNYCYRQLQKYGVASVYSEIGNIQFQSNGDIPKFGYSTGINLIINCANNFDIETGLQYANCGYKNSTSTALVNIYNSPNNPNVYYTNHPYYYNNYNIVKNGIPIYLNCNYAGIPVIAKFVVKKSKKIKIIAGIGLLIDILIGENMKIELPDGLNTLYPYGPKGARGVDPYFWSNFNLAPIASFGVEFKLNDRMCLRAEPHFQYDFLPTSQTDPQNYLNGEHLWNVGINMSFLCDLHKRLVKNN